MICKVKKHKENKNMIRDNETMAPEQINIKDVLGIQLIDGCSLELCVATVVSSATEIKSTLHDSFLSRGEREK